MPPRDPVQADIRALFKNLQDACRRKDLTDVMACYAPDIVAFDLMPPLATRGGEAYRKNWDEAFRMSEGPFEIEHRDLVIHASGDVAFAYALEHVRVKARPDNHEMDMWLRMTCGLRRIEGAWKIVHEQDSVPIDMKDDKPLWNLKPEALAA